MIVFVTLSVYNSCIYSIIIIQFPKFELTIENKIFYSRQFNHMEARSWMESAKRMSGER